jgi:hypothetical protein
VGYAQRLPDEGEQSSHRRQHGGGLAGGRGDDHARPGLTGQEQAAPPATRGGRAGDGGDDPTCPGLTGRSGLHCLPRKGASPVAAVTLARFNKAA